MLDPPPSLSSLRSPLSLSPRLVAPGESLSSFHSALASSLEASVSALSLSPRLLARGERLSSFTQPSPPRSRRASQLEGRRPSPAVGRREVERTLLLERG